MQAFAFKCNSGTSVREDQIKREGKMMTTGTDTPHRHKLDTGTIKVTN